MSLHRNITVCPKCGSLNEEDAVQCTCCGEQLLMVNIRTLSPGTSVYNGFYTISEYIGCEKDTLIYKVTDKTGEEATLWEYYPGGIVVRKRFSNIVLPFQEQEVHIFEEGKSKFLWEGKVFLQLEGVQGIIPVKEVFEENGTAYWIGKLVEGIDLESLLYKVHKVSFQEAVKIMKPVLETLSAVHQKGFLHQDIKPANILKSGNHIYVTGFRNAGTNEFISSAVKDNFPAEERLLSDPYAAPEQVTDGALLGPWTDVYGAAAVLYRLVTGLNPVNPVSREKGKTLKSPINVGANITENQADVLERGLSLSSSLRYQNAASFLKNLEIVKNESNSEPVKVDYDIHRSQKDGEKDIGADDGEKKARGFIAIGILVAICLFLFVRFLGDYISGSNGKEEATNAGKGEVSNSLNSNQSVKNSKIEQNGLLRLVAWNGNTYGFYDIGMAGISDYDDIVAFASEMDAYPAVIDSYEENNFLYNQTLAGGMASAYFGYHSGIEGNVWTWPDGRESVFFNWAKNEPNYSGRSDSAAFARFSPYYMNGRWECSSLDSLYPFIIEWNQKVEGATYLDKTQNIYDVSAFTYENSAYGIYNMADYGLNTIRDSGTDNSDVEFGYLVDFCRVRGGYLAVINDENENYFLFNKVMESGEDSAFFGYTDQVIEGKWQWVDRQSSYENWSSGQPNDGVGTADGDVKLGEDYAQFFHKTKNGTWNDSLIHINTRAFIVEWDR